MRAKTDPTHHTHKIPKTSDAIANPFVVVGAPGAVPTDIASLDGWKVFIPHVGQN